MKDVQIEVAKAAMAPKGAVAATIAGAKGAMAPKGACGGNDGRGAKGAKAAMAIREAVGQQQPGLRRPWHPRGLWQQLRPGLKQGQLWGLRLLLNLL